MKPASPNGQIGSERGNARGDRCPIDTPYLVATLLLTSLAKKTDAIRGKEKWVQDLANKGALNSKLGSFLRISPDPAIVMNENMAIQITACCHLGMTKTSFGRFVTVRIGGFPLSKSPIIPNFSKCLFIRIKHSLSVSPPIAFTLQENSPVSGSPSMKYLDEIT